jgi:hypothetical protein
MSCLVPYLLLHFIENETNPNSIFNDSHHINNSIVSSLPTTRATRLQASLASIKQRESKFTSLRNCAPNFMALSNASVTFQSWIPRQSTRQIILLSPYDCEEEMLLIKLEVMGPYIDYFVIGEASISNSNIQRTLCFEKVKTKILDSDYGSKVLYHVIDERANNFQYWEQEVLVRNQLAKPLFQDPNILSIIHDDAFLILLDMDEMISSAHMHFLRSYDHPNSKFRSFRISLKWSYYGFEWVNPGVTTINSIITWKHFRSECKMMANAIRFNLCNEQEITLLPMIGWHCSWCYGNTSQFIQKIERSAHSEYNQDRFKDIVFLEGQRKRGLWFVDSQPNGCFYGTGLEIVNHVLFNIE